MGLTLMASDSNQATTLDPAQITPLAMIARPQSAHAVARE